MIMRTKFIESSKLKGEWSYEDGKNENQLWQTHLDYFFNVPRGRLATHGADTIRCLYGVFGKTIDEYVRANAKSLEKRSGDIKRFFESVGRNIPINPKILLKGEAHLLIQLYYKCIIINYEGSSKMERLMLNELPTGPRTPTLLSAYQHFYDDMRKELNDAISRENNLQD